MNINLAKNDKIQSNPDEKQATGINRKALMDNITDALYGTDFENEEAKKAYEEKVSKKIQAGKKLTPAEKSYIQRTNPYLYMQVVRLEMKRETVEKRLQACKSKKQVENVISEEIANISKKDPAKEAMINTVQDAAKEFKKTDKYKRLPETSKEDDGKKVNKKNPKIRNDLVENNDTNNSSDTEELNYNVSLGQYQEAFIDDGQSSIRIDMKS